jgi:acyl-CoA thioester hydrolase
MGMKRLVDICKRQVRFSEIDSMKCVWHGSYITYLEDGRESFGRRYPGIGYADMQNIGIYAPVYDVHLRYLTPLILNDEVRIETTYIHRPGARLDYAYKLYRERDNQLCVEASTTQLFIDSNGKLLVDIPEFYQLWQEKHMSL